MQTHDGVQVVRRDAYEAMMILDPCDSQWRRYVLVCHPAKSKSTMGGKPLLPEVLQVQILRLLEAGELLLRQRAAGDRGQGRARAEKAGPRLARVGAQEGRTGPAAAR